MEVYVEHVEAELDLLAWLLGVAASSPLPFTVSQRRHFATARNIIRGRVQHTDIDKRIGAATVVLQLVNAELREARDDRND